MKPIQSKKRGTDDNGNRFWTDGQGHVYYAVQLQMHSTDEATGDGSGNNPGGNSANNNPNNYGDENYNAFNNPYSPQNVAPPRGGPPAPPSDIPAFNIPAFNPPGGNQPSPVGGNTGAPAPFPPVAPAMNPVATPPSLGSLPIVTNANPVLGNMRIKLPQAAIDNLRVQQPVVPYGALMNPNSSNNDLNEKTLNLLKDIAGRVNKKIGKANTGIDATKVYADIVKMQLIKDKNSGEYYDSKSKLIQDASSLFAGLVAGDLLIAGKVMEVGQGIMENNLEYLHEYLNDLGELRKNPNISNREDTRLFIVSSQFEIV